MCQAGSDEACGWKVCHVARVGASDRLPATALPLPTLRERHRRLLALRNMFVVAKAYGGLGELPKFLAAFRDMP